MKKIIVIILWFLLVSLDSNKPQNISVSSEVEKLIHKDTNVVLVFEEVKIKKKHPYLKFCEEYQMIAMDCQIRYGVPSSIQLAQAIAESGGGGSPLAKEANNLFGMKYYKELYDGEYYVSMTGTKWRKYNSFEHSFKDHADFLKKFYPSAVGKNWKYWVDNCKGYGFTGYWKHIGMVIEKYSLWEYDEVVIPQPERTYNL
jgi:flagellum-specific peptidoglycan hydrolase FlgJ